ncbi:hypothetical protein TcWFU_003376 [Taenia crassiceps]|uniref:Uncharacterized protein n=1 Tax=Taenia crassiceps TaxID=6207 RepID=A0ABR4QK91_9CEST
MKVYILCLLVAAATAARPYKYKSVKRPSESYFPMYFRASDRVRGGEGESFGLKKPQDISRSAVQQGITEGKVAYGRVSKGVQKEKELIEEQPISKALQEDLEIEYGYDEDYKAKNAGGLQEDVEEEEVAYDEDHDIESDEEDVDEHDEYDSKDYDEDEDTEEEGEEEDEVDEYEFEKDYKGEEGDGEEYEDVYDIEYTSETEGKKEDAGSGETHEKSMNAMVEQTTQTMSLEEADKIFAFPGCDSITCSKAAYDGYGCSASKCKYICTRTECYEYPDGPTTLEESVEQEGVVEAKVEEEGDEKDLEEEVEIEEYEEEEEKETVNEVTTTTTTTPEPETLPPRKEVRRRRGRSGKGKSGRNYKL